MNNTKHLTYESICEQVIDTSRTFRPDKVEWVREQLKKKQVREIVEDTHPTIMQITMSLLRYADRK